MKQNYDDIISRISEAPKWFDEHGTPRYDEFRPWLVGNIYAREVVLALICCPHCRRIFMIAISAEHEDDKLPLASRIAEKELWYRDPPNVGCCASGPSTNSVTLQVVEYWKRDRDSRTGWRRDPALEGPSLHPMYQEYVDLIDAT